MSKALRESYKTRTKKVEGKIKLFLDEYLATGDKTESALKAGIADTKKNASSRANDILRRKYVQSYLREKNELMTNRSIAKGVDVLNFFTRAMNGEIKDQFGLDATLSDRIKAAQELAKRTVDIENQTKEAPQIQITLKWSD